MSSVIREHSASYVSNDDKDNPWIPWDEQSGSTIKICRLNRTSGEIVVLMRTPPGRTVGRHFHPGTVAVYVVQGEWTYNEGWVARPGDVVLEGAGGTHAPTMVGQQDTIIFAVIQGSLEYVDENGDSIGRDNWRSFYQLYLDHCTEHGLTPREDVLVG